MNGHAITLADTALTALPSGALWWQGARVLCVSDLHLGKTERIARRGGSMLPPYEVTDTLARLGALITALDPAQVICLGDSFDDLAAAEAVADEVNAWLVPMQAGRRWIWIAGNHDAGPVALGGSHLAELKLGALTFRHIAEPEETGEISGHYHPKAALRGISRPAFLIDAARVIMPAFGTYTGGLRCTDPVLTGLMANNACALMTGARITALPMPRGR